MRIRRRPQQPSSLSLQQQQQQQAVVASDLAAATSTAPQTPQNAARNRGWLDAAAGQDEDRAGAAKLLLQASADLVLGGHKSGVARRLALPQDDNVVVVDCGWSRSRSMGAQQHGADDGRMRLSAAANGHRSGSEHKDDDSNGRAICTTGAGIGGRYYEPSVPVKAEERVTTTSNGFVVQPAATAAAVVVANDDEAGKKQQQPTTSTGTGTGTGPKKRRGPAVLLEGSRCSRVNGRGWRCSQPTLVGYSLCEHHLGKGRMRSAAAAAAARAGSVGGVGRLGRTEHNGPRIATAVAPSQPKAEGPSLPGC